MCFFNYVKIRGVQFSALIKKNKLHIKGKKTYFFILIQDSYQLFSLKDANPNLFIFFKSAFGMS